MTNRRFNINQIVLQKLALNSENAAQSFDNKVHALEYSARTLCQEFYDETLVNFPCLNTNVLLTPST